VVSSTYDTITGIIEYADTGDPVDPNITIGQVGFIARKSPTVGLGWISSSDIQGIPVRIVQMAMNSDLTNRIDTAVSTKASKDGLQTIVHTIVPAESITKSFTLPFIPADPTDVIMDVVGGIDGTYGVDFIITGDTFSWSGLGFDGLLGSGDVVRLVYFTI